MIASDRPPSEDRGRLLRSSLVFSLAMLLAGSGACRSESRQHSLLVCSYSYGGTARELIARPSVDPYTVASTDVQQRFAFKVVYQREPVAINVYVYERAAPKDVLLHEVKYAPPFPTAARDAAFGFTGQHLVYSSQGRELQYHCALRDSR